MRIPMWLQVILGAAVVWLALLVFLLAGPARAQEKPTPAPVPATPEVVPLVPLPPDDPDRRAIEPIPPDRPPMVLREKLVKAVAARDRARAQVRALRATLRRHPDFDVSLQLAAIAYGQDWRALRACALSEGAREAERFDRHNRRLNTGGSGATSSFQFMRSTFLSTPFAALDWHRQDVQAHAAAWMWSRGRRGEWTGKGC